MLREIRRRLERLERRIWAQLPFWPSDDDGFIAALGVNPERFKIINADGSGGYDPIAALSITAKADWRERE